jgi:hypothetical protein
MLTAWLNSWTGARELIDAMNGHSYDVRLGQSPFGWWAEFCREAVNPLPRCQHLLDDRSTGPCSITVFISQAPANADHPLGGQRCAVHRVSLAPTACRRVDDGFGIGSGRLGLRRV